MDLTKTYREEKAAHRLIEIDEAFFERALKHLASLESEAKTLQGTEADIMSDTIKAEMRSLKSIKDIRIKKLYQAALSDAYRDKPDHAYDHMLKAERAFYERTLEEIRVLRTP